MTPIPGTVCKRLLKFIQLGDQRAICFEFVTALGNL